MHCMFWSLLFTDTGKVSTNGFSGCLVGYRNFVAVVVVASGVVIVVELASIVEPVVPLSAGVVTSAELVISGWVLVAGTSPVLVSGEDVAFDPEGSVDSVILVGSVLLAFETMVLGVKDPLMKAVEDSGGSMVVVLLSGSVEESGTIVEESGSPVVTFSGPVVV